RHRTRRPGVECLEDRRLPSAISEFPLPTADNNPGDLTVGPDGNLWFAEYSVGSTGIESGSAIGRITPSGAVTEFPLPTADSDPGDLTVGPDGNLWFAESPLSSGHPGDVPQPGAIVRITPAGAITEFPLTTAIAYPGTLTAGPDGDLWFSEESLAGPGG